MFRLVNDEGEPVLYEPDLFTVIDGQVPSNWHWVAGSEGEWYAYPPELNEPGFFEDWHDGVPSAVSAFARYLKSLQDERGGAPKP